MDAIYTTFTPRRGESLQRQITIFLRSLIRQDRLKANDKIPTVRELAQFWGTNIFTVQSAVAPLVSEGLIARRPRLGTFVRARSDRLNSVALYHNVPLALDARNSFSSRVHIGLYARLCSMGVNCYSWFDTRPESRETTPPPDMARLMREHMTQALIATSLNKYNLKWVRRMGVPTAMMAGTSVPGSVGLDDRLMIRLALEELKAAGCRTVGVVSHGETKGIKAEGGPFRDHPFYAKFLEEVAALGLVTAPDWIVAPAERTPIERWGYEGMSRLLASSRRPDGLFVFPDTIAPGVFHALLEKRVKVPKQLKLTVHKNAEIELFSPVPVTAWLVFGAERTVDGLLRQIELQRDGLEAPRLDLPVDVVRGA